MSSTITPTQFRYNDPYQSEIFGYNTPESKLYKSSATNGLFKIIGNDIVVKGLNIDALTVINNSIVKILLTDGITISDSTIIKINESSNIAINCAELSDTNSGSHLAVFLNYKFIYHANPRLASIDFFHISPFGSVTDPDGRFDPAYHRLLLAIIDFIVFEGNVIIVQKSFLSELLVEGVTMSLRGINDENLVLPKLFIRSSSNLVNETYEYLLKKDYLLME